jgi:hypothetical protein
MAKTRAHELAKEYGVDAAWVLARFREMGEFVKSASSTVELAPEMQFRKEIGERLRAGESPAKVAAASASRPQGPRPARATAKKPPRRTSWDSSSFPSDVADLWRRQGLGEADAPLALYLLENGLLPEDLALDLRGRPAAVRLREGFESRAVLVREMHEARASAAVVPRPLPSTKIERRYVGDG